MTDIFSLYLKYAPDAKAAQSVFAHTSIVFRIAKDLALKNKLDIDWQILETGCLIHDIGVFECEEYQAKNPKPYIQHFLLGSLIVRAEGFNDQIAKMVERHIGIGLTAEEIVKQNLPLPPFDFLPETVEEKLLCYADKFHSKDKGFCTYEYRLQQYTDFGPGPVERLRDLKEEFGLPEISEIR